MKPRNAARLVSYLAKEHHTPAVNSSLHKLDSRVLPIVLEKLPPHILSKQTSPKLNTPKGTDEIQAQTSQSPSVHRDRRDYVKWRD